MRILEGAQSTLHCRLALATLGAVLLLAAPFPAIRAQEQQGANDDKTGARIASQARAAHVDRAQVTRGSLGGQSVVFTPVSRTDLPSDGRGVSAGMLAGMVDIGAAKGTIAAGHYDAYVWHAPNGWTAVLERDGKILVRSNDVVLDEYPPQGSSSRSARASAKPSVHLTSAAMIISTANEGWQIQLTYPW